MRKIWRRLHESLLEDLSTPAARAVAGRARWEPGIDVVESPFLPPDTFIIGAHGAGARMWDTEEPLFRFTEPLWEPPSTLVTNRRTFAGQPAVLHDVYVDERARALDFLEQLLDTTCHDLGLDPDAAWKDARRQQTRDRAYRDRQVLWQAEARMSFAINRPESFVTVIP